MAAQLTYLYDLAQEAASNLTVDQITSSIILGRKWTEISQTGEHRCKLLAGRERSQSGGINKLGYK